MNTQSKAAPIAPETQLIHVFIGTIANHVVQLVDARLLHQHLEVKRDFSTWIKKRLTDGGFVEDNDYLLTQTGEQLPSGTKYRIDYHLTLETAKHIGMMERNEKGRQIRDYFIVMEQAALRSNEQSAQLPEPKTKKALPGCLTLDQQDAVKALVKERVEPLPKAKQAGATIRLWSAVKKKFGVSYKEISSDNFVNVVSLIARLPLEGELLDAEPQPALPAPGLTFEQIEQLIDRKLQAQRQQPALPPPRSATPETFKVETRCRFSIDDLIYVLCQHGYKVTRER